MSGYFNPGRGAASGLAAPIRDSAGAHTPYRPPIEIPGCINDGHPHHRHLQMKVGSRVVDSEFPFHPKREGGFDRDRLRAGTVTEKPTLRMPGYQNNWSVMVVWDGDENEGSCEECCEELSIIKGGSR